MLNRSRFDTLRNSPRGRSHAYEFGVIGAAVSAAALYLVHPLWAEDLWGAPLSLLSFALGLYVVRPARLEARMLVNPHNLTLLWFAGATIIAPISVLIFGFTQGPLPGLPDVHYSNAAIGLYNISFWSYLIGYSLHKPHKSTNYSHRVGGAGGGYTLQSSLLLIFSFLGLSGIFLRFGSIGELLAFFGDTRNIAVTASLASLTPAQVVGNLLRPCAFFGMIALWANWRVKQGTDSSPLIAILTTVWIFVTVMFNLSFNRGALVITFLVVAAVIDAKIRRIRHITVVFVGCALWVGLVVLGEVRGSSSKVVDALNDISVGEQVVKEGKISDSLQVYLGGPQFLGYLLAEIKEGYTFRLGSSIVASMLFSVPIIGENFRPHAGVTLYNEMIYGKTSGFLDQIIPSQGEVWLNFGIIGFLPAYLGFGLAVSVLQHRFLAAASSDSAAVMVCWLLLGYWFSMGAIGSIAAVSQFFIYQAPPIIIFLLVSNFRNRLP
jgi:hypothetical protein